MALFLAVHSLSFLHAGDVATFVDLGFSADGKVYLFAQYGVQAGTLRPWAELFAVDVARNDFITDGRQRYVHDSAVVSGQDGAGALYLLISGNALPVKNYGINFLTHGRLLYISPGDGVLPSPATPIEFRDFTGGTNYRAALVSQITGTGSSLKSSFYIDFERIFKDGSRKSYVVGSPQVKRPLAVEYHIYKIILDPRQESVVFVIEQKIQNEADSGYNIRYMVETLPL
jgi:predicted secreted protein